MKQFSQRQLHAARTYAEEGGQALHLHRINHGHRVFKKHPVIAHLFDQDRERLIRTARRLGVRKIKVEREGTASMHIDLCGKPFDRACEESEPVETEETKEETL